jgi:fatty-acyl-CoA synthase
MLGTLAPPECKEKAAMQGLMQSYPLTLTHVFRRAERLFPEKEIATVQGDGIVRITYGEWAERTRRLAGVLDAMEISADARVGTFAWNTARHLELYFAAPCSGRVLHTLNVRLFPDDVVYIADHAEDEIVFVDRSLLKVFWPLVDRFETVKHVVVMDDGSGNEVPDDPRVHDYEDLLSAAEPVDFPLIEDENQAAAMCYTSGTTGHPKGVVYSHRSTVLHSMGSLVADAAGVSERDTIMPVVPMFHANAWGLCQAAVMAGSSLAMPGANMQPKALAELMESEKVTLAAGVPTIWMAVLPELEGRDLSSLREILCGGSAVPKSLSEAYREKVGLPILQAWGMTETSPVATTGRVKSTLLDRSDEELADLRAAQGLAIPLVDLRIVEPGTDDELPWDGQARGELQARGPWIAAGYYNDDRSSDSFTEDGWLRTGDVATISPNGYVRLVDRTKDLVKSGGEWISSVELENAIMAHPKVAEAAVIGIPDEKWSERPLACVVPEGDEEITLDELKAFLAERVPKWWIPNDLEIIEEVPKTSVGKFSKKTLREQFAARHATA